MEFTKDGITFKLINGEIFAETTDFIFHNAFPTENDAVLFNHLYKTHNESYILSYSVSQCGINSTLGVIFTSNHADGLNYKIEFGFKCVDVNKKGKQLKKLKQLETNMDIIRKRITEDKAKLEELEKEYVDKMCKLEH
jgi:hypothetical protein